MPLNALISIFSTSSNAKLSLTSEGNKLSTRSTWIYYVSSLGKNWAWNGNGKEDEFDGGGFLWIYEPPVFQ